MIHPNLLHWYLGTNPDQLPPAAGIVSSEAQHSQTKGVSQKVKSGDGEQVQKIFWVAHFPPLFPC